jgi:hypothetical protein
MRLLRFVFVATCAAFSWTNKKFVSSVVPSSDLKRIDAMQCSHIAARWYEIVLNIGDQESSHEITVALQNAIELRNRVDNDFTLQSISRLEAILNDPFNEYFAWMPREVSTNASKDTLALAVCQKHNMSLAVRCIICHPSYSWSEHIALSELKRALRELIGFESEDEELNFDEFALRRENQRIMLEWLLD